MKLHTVDQNFQYRLGHKELVSWWSASFLLCTHLRHDLPRPGHSLRISNGYRFCELSIILMVNRLTNLCFIDVQLFLLWRVVYTPQHRNSCTFVLVQYHLGCNCKGSTKVTVDQSCISSWIWHIMQVEFLQGSSHDSQKVCIVGMLSYTLSYCLSFIVPDIGFPSQLR
jgi:hypothetical protein